MRKKFVLFVLVPVIVILVVVYLFIDRWVAAGLEAGGEAIVGAKVEIEQLHVRLSPIGIEWRRLQVADPHDPWKNLFETGTVRFALNFGQLLRNKYIVESMEVNDLIVGTKRTTDGSLPKPKNEPEAGSSGGSAFSSLAAQTLNNLKAETPLLNLDQLRGGVNADSLVKALDIKSLKHLDSLQAQVNASSKQWDAVLSDVEASKGKLTDISTKVKAINPSDLKSPDKILEAISVVNNAVTDVNNINTTFSARKASIEGDLQKLSASAGAIDDIAKSDFQHLLSLARLPDLNTAGIARLLIGQEMYNKATGYLYWIDRGRQYVKRYSPDPKPEQPPRMRGQDIQFPVERAYPKFWIKKILVSGGTDSTQQADYIHARGEVKNVTNDQTATGVPLTVNLEGSQAGVRALSASAILDRTKEIPFDQYKATLSGVPLSEFKLGSSGFMPSKITNARVNTSVTIAVPGSAFDATTHMEFGNVNIAFEGEARNTIERLVREVLQATKSFDIDLRLWTTGGPMDVALATNLDDQIARRVKDVLGAEFTKVQNDLRAKFDATIGEKRKAFEAMYAGKKAAVESKLAAVQNLVNDNLSLLEGKKKDLSDKLEKEKKGKMDDVLKKILK